MKIIFKYLISCMFFVVFHVQGEETKLENIDVKFVKNEYKEKYSEEPGVWFCQYQEKNTKNTVLLEIDEHTVYVKLHDKYYEMDGRNNNKTRKVYFSNGLLEVEIFNIHDSNFDEYNESFDRTADLFLRGKNKTSTYHVFAKGCGI